MSADGIGLVLDIQDRPASRRELTVTANDFGQTKLTLAAGVIGTHDAQEVIRQAADRATLAMTPRRRKLRPGQEI